MRYNTKEIEGMLYDYKVLKATNSNRQMELEDIETGVGSPNLESVGGKTNKITSLVELSAITNIEKKEEIKKAYDRDERKVRLIENGLMALTTMERKIVEAKYFERLQWWEVATEVKFSDERCRQIKREALGKLARVVNM